jgi:predicted RNA-binding Zn ribbon-like protein
MDRSGTRDADWKDGFLFLGNHLTLDFVNTRPIMDGEPRELLPDVRSLMQWFQAAGLLPDKDLLYQLASRWEKTKKAQQTLDGLIALRERLRGAIVKWEQTGMVPRSLISELNRLLQRHPMLLKVEAERNSLRTELWFDPREPEDLFTPIVHSAATLFANVDWHRVRQCGNCVLHFLDTSKKGTRRWCSMQLCGNRVKVAAYAKRQLQRLNCS